MFKLFSAKRNFLVLFLADKNINAKTHKEKKVLLQFCSQCSSLVRAPQSPL